MLPAHLPLRRLSPLPLRRPPNHPFSRLPRSQVRRRWFPKVKVTVLEPVKLAVDPTLKGRARRQAAGAALYGIMSDLVFRTTSTDRTVFEALLQASEEHGRSRIAVEDPVSGVRPGVATKKPCTPWPVTWPA